ncbi:hypothetical protein CIL03_16430 [Virgibacillus indicus]|uniref:Uncharacterized protein n=1 Tax=Virgibacillus indicus TaxID=2024554 RepID=A0A265N7U2_9BACI|nr:hypothetical protein [Virgibacillus indicus]OZU87406.1 hypothetical protein CIL03_16430 [Virgibacillus indicus]
MRNSFRKIFLGFLLVLIDIHIFIDILPNPVGYFLIGAGITELPGKFAAGNKAYSMAIFLCLLSIPTLFIPQHTIENLLSMWGIYFTLLVLLKLILTFYLFQIMMEIVKDRNEMKLENRTAKIFKEYMIVMFAIQIGIPFTMNLSRNIQSGYTMITTIIALILEVIFMVLLLSFRDVDDEGKESITV